MSIYVRVGDETICVRGSDADAGAPASSAPIPVEVLELEVARSRARQARVARAGAEGEQPLPDDPAEAERKLVKTLTLACRLLRHLESSRAGRCVVFHPFSPYTRRGMTAFVDDQLDSMLRTPRAWGSPAELELQVLLLLEVRAFVVSGSDQQEDVDRAYAVFVADQLSSIACAVPTAAPLADQLVELGRVDELVGMLGEFVAARRGA